MNTALHMYTGEKRKESSGSFGTGTIGLMKMVIAGVVWASFQLSGGMIFMLAGTPVHAETAGLTKSGNDLLLNGVSFKGIGVNYFEGFNQRLIDHNDVSYRNDLPELREQGISFCRVPIFTAADTNANSLYLSDTNTFFSYLDDFVQCAEVNNIGLILDLVWDWDAICPLLGETRCDLADTNSLSFQFINRIVEDVVSRYADSKAVWAWECSNEMNLGVDLPNRDPSDPLWITTETMADVYLEFENRIRQYDTNRLIFSGNALNRPAQWHMWAEGTWGEGYRDSRSEYEEILSFHNPLDTITSHIYPGECDTNGISEHDDEFFSDDAVRLVDLVGENTSMARATNKVFYLGEFSGMHQYNSALIQELMIYDYIQEIFNEDTLLSSVWNWGYRTDSTFYYNIINPTNHNAWIIEYLTSLNDAFRLGKATDADIGSPGLAGSSEFTVLDLTAEVKGAGQMNLTNDAFHFMMFDKPLSNDCEITVCLDSQEQASAFARAGIVFRGNPWTSDSRYVMVGRQPTTSGCRIGFWRRDAEWTSTEADFISQVTTLPVYLKLKRVDDYFSAFMSTNNTAWQQIGTAQSVSFPNPQYNKYGLGVSSHTYTNLSTAQFSEMFAERWSGCDFGNAVADPEGGDQFDTGTEGIRLSGTGGFYSVHDGGHFYHVTDQLIENGEIIARVVSMDTNMTSFGKAGVMMREDLTDDCRYAQIAIQPVGRAGYWYRQEDGESYQYSLVSSISAPYWVRLVREGNVYSGYISDDGASWQQVGSSVTNIMNANLEAGLVVSPNRDDETGDAVFDHISIIRY